MRWLLLVLTFCIQLQAGYTYSRSITIDHTKVGTVNNTDQSNFPVLIQGTYSYLATVANGGLVQNTFTLNGQTVAADLVFTSDSGCTTLLPFEIEAYSATTGAITYWVKVTTVSHTTDTVFTECYGNASVTTNQSNQTGTWDTNYVAVYHWSTVTGTQTISGTALPVNDSSSQANNMTTNDASSSAPTVITGQIGTALDFGSKNMQPQDSGPPTNLPSGSAVRTMEVWANENNNTTNNQTIFAYGTNQTAESFTLFWGGNGDQHMYVTDTGAGVDVAFSTDAVWHYWVAVLPSGTSSTGFLLYKDGALQTTSTVGSNTVNTVVSAIQVSGNVAASSPANSYFGQIDESRVSKSVRSADWIKTSWNSQNSPSTFYTVGSQVSSTVPNQFPRVI